MPDRVLTKAVEGLDTDQYGRVHSVPNVADLRALPTEYQQGVARTRGYYAPNDGGGGPDWMWDSTAARSCTVDGINLINLTNHGYKTGDKVRFYGTLPTNISAGTDYYVMYTDANKFGVGSTQGQAYSEVGRNTLSVVSSGLSVNRGDDACLVVVPNNDPANGRWRRIWDGTYLSVLWAGAKGDAGPMTTSGATGTIDTVPIQQAIHEAGPGSTLDFHDRRYRTATLALRHGDTVITGQGATLVSNVPQNTGAAGEYSIMYYLPRRTLNGNSLSATPSLNEGQDEIELASSLASQVTVGDILRINTPDTMGTGNYPKGSLKIVRAVSGTTITLDSGLDWTIPPATATIVSWKNVDVGRNQIVEGLNFEVIPAYRQDGLKFSFTENVEVRNCKFYGGSGQNSLSALWCAGFDFRIHDCYFQDWLDVPNKGVGYGVQFVGHNARVHNNTFLRCKHATTTGGGDFKSTRMHVYANYAWDCHTAAWDIHANAKWCKIEDNFYLEIGKTNHDGVPGATHYWGVFLRSSDAECRRNVFVASKTPGDGNAVAGIGVSDSASDNLIIEDNQLYGVYSGVQIENNPAFTTRNKNIRIRGNQVFRQSTVTTSMGPAAGIYVATPALHDSEIADNVIDVNTTGVFIVGAKNTKISGNKITWGNTTDTWPRAGGTITTAAGILLYSNAAETHTGTIISDNTFAVGAAVSAQTAVGHVRIMANHNDITIEGNQFDNTNLNAGAATVRYDEATQLTRMVRQANIGDKFTTQSITAAATQIKPFGELVVLTANATYILSTVPIIPDGFDGQEIVLFNNGTNTITLRDQGTLTNSNLRLAVASTGLAARDTLPLRFSSAIGDWIQTAPLTNLI